MSEKKKKLSFADLGLSTPLPNSLSKSRAQRKQEEIQSKKDKKLRVKHATENVAASRALVEKHKAVTEKEEKEGKLEKAQRKRELNIERTRTANERRAEEKLKDAELARERKEFVTHLVEQDQRVSEEQKVLMALIEKQKMDAVRDAPKSAHISIHRTEEIVRQREGLPVLREEQPIVEAINEADRTCVLLCGETGSGKTTQVPQFLWEAGYGHEEGSQFGREGCILVTEPRRVAAVSMARRVAEELNVTFGDEVCYHVRYDNNMSDHCRLKFATEGIALKEIQSDFLLSSYSAIIVDEAHERSVSCDLLVGLLSRILPLRNDLFKEEMLANKGDISKVKIRPLRLVIMSATMRVADFRDNRTLFPVVPRLINVEARRFPVSNHFERKTELKEYVDQAFEKIRQIHKKLPPGGILVFLCTQQEIEDLCARLRKHYASTKIEYYEESYAKHEMLQSRRDRAAEEDASSSDGDDVARKTDEEHEKDEYGLHAEDYDLDNEGELVVPGATSLDDSRSDSGAQRRRARQNDDGTDVGETPPPMEEGEVNGEYNTLHVLPLYALLDFKKQQEVFKTPPKGCRLCVVATNVAETSITIPNIRYVVDAGRSKSKVIEDETKASCFRIDWVSQASAEQRSGRAGRVGPGHCYRLYSTAVYANVMSKHSIPEILRTPLDSVVLLMKHLGIETVGAFPFPSCPRAEDMKAALNHLTTIGALDKSTNYRITNLGRELIVYPVPPRFARAIVEARQKRCSTAFMDLVLRIVAVASTTANVFTGEGNQLKASKKDECSDPVRRDRIRGLVNGGSDLLTFLNAFSVYMQDMRGAHRSYCLVQKSMSEARMLHRQLRALVRQTEAIPPENASIDVEHTSVDADAIVDTMDTNESWTLGPEDRHGGADKIVLSHEEETLLRQVFIPGLLDQVARRATVHECRALGVEYNDKRTSRTPYVISATHSVAFVHPTSSVARVFPPPEFVTFAFLQKVFRSESKAPQTTMLGVTVVTKEWLDLYSFEE